MATTGVNRPNSAHHDSGMPKRGINLPSSASGIHSAVCTVAGANFALCDGSVSSSRRPLLKARGCSQFDGQRLGQLCVINDGTVIGEEW